MQERKGIIAFLVIAFGMAWVIWESLLRLGFNVSDPMFTAIGALPGAFSPAVAAFVVRKWITREGFSDAGLKLNLRKWPYYVFGLLLPLLGLACIVGLAMLFRINPPDFSLLRGLNYIVSTAGAAPPTAPSNPWRLVFLLPIVAVLAMPLYFGEEFGWRGYLQPRLFPTRPLAAAIATGLIWAPWHYPLMFRGFDFPDNRILGPLIFPICAVFLSIIFGWLRSATGSIWACSLAHSATNIIGGILGVFLFGGGGHFLFVSYVGILGWIPLGALSAWIVLSGRLQPAKSSQTMSRELAEV
jgi:membrane protease YdiL (CAAX protease family)